MLQERKLCSCRISAIFFQCCFMIETCCFMVETQALMAVSDISGFFSRNYFLEGGFTFHFGGGAGGFRQGASFVSGAEGGAPWGASILMGERLKNHRMGGGVPPHYGKPWLLSKPSRGVAYSVITIGQYQGHQIEKKALFFHT